MAGEFSIPQVTPTPDSQQLIVGATLRHNALSKVELFLKSGRQGVGKIACDNCRTADLCGAVASKITEQSDDSTISPTATKLLESHGVRVEDDQLCPRRLIDSATHLEEQGDFWVATNDPLNTAASETRTAEAVRIATQELAERISSNLHI